MTKPYEARVRLGAAFLDEKKPGWWDGKKRKKINLELLDMGSPCRCVLGQLSGERMIIGSPTPYAVGATSVGISPSSTASDALGFSVYGHNDERYPSLTRRWREEIENRRKEAGIS